MVAPPGEGFPQVIQDQSDWLPDGCCSLRNWRRCPAQVPIRSLMINNILIIITQPRGSGGLIKFQLLDWLYRSVDVGCEFPTSHARVFINQSML